MTAEIGTSKVRAGYIAVVVTIFISSHQDWKIRKTKAKYISSYSDQHIQKQNNSDELNFVGKISNPGDFREHLLISHCNNNVNDNEFCLLYDLNKSKNADIPCWVYRNFDIEEKNDDECLAEFRI